MISRDPTPNDAQIELTKNRVGGSSRSRPLTPPSIRIRTWRFD